MMSNVNSPRSKQNFILHPLIHTLLKSNLAQDVVDISKVQKCGLKYVMQSFEMSVRGVDVNSNF